MIIKELNKSKEHKNAYYALINNSLSISKTQSCDKNVIEIFRTNIFRIFYFVVLI